MQTEMETDVARCLLGGEGGHGKARLATRADPVGDEVEKEGRAQHRFESQMVEPPQNALRLIKIEKRSTSNEF